MCVIYMPWDVEIFSMGGCLCVHLSMVVYLHTYVRMYWETCIIRPPLGNENRTGLAGCWIIVANFYGKINVRYQRILTGLSKCWFIEIPEETGSTAFPFVVPCMSPLYSITCFVCTYVPG